MITEWSFYPLAVVAMLLVGISKSGFGGGLGVLAVPLMSLVISPPRAAAIMLPLLIGMDWLTIYHYRRNWDRRNLLILIPAALLGILLGSLFFRYLSEAHIRILIGLLAIFFVANFFIGTGRGKSKQSADLKDGGGDDVAVNRKPQPSLPAGIFWGAVAGFTSFGVHAGGPPVNIYLLPQKLEKSLFVGTTVIFFTAVNMVKLVPYTLLGQFSSDNLLTSLLLSPLAPLGVWLGMRLHRMVREQLFYRLCYIFLLVTGTKLLFDGIKGLL